MDRLFALVRKYLPWLYTTAPARAWVAFSVALASILGAYVSQYVFGILPCELCYWQRWPYYIGVPLLGLTLLFWKRIPAPTRLGLTLVSAFIYVVSMGLGTYHAGIEYKLWPGPTSCTGLDTQLDFSDLSNITAADKVIPCDVVPFEIFGISLAGFNALGSLFIAFMLFWSVVGQYKRMKGAAV